MKKLFAFFIIFFACGNVQAIDTVSVDGNDIVISTTAEKERIPNIYSDKISPEDISPQDILKLIRGEAKKIKLGNKLIGLEWGFPLKVIHAKTNIVLTGGILTKEISYHVTSNLPLTIIWIIIPFIFIFCFSIYFLLKNEEPHGKLVIFYITLLTGVIFGAFAGELAGGFDGGVAGAVVSAVAGGVAGGFAGGLAGAVVSVVTDVFVETTNGLADGVAGEFARTYVGAGAGAGAGLLGWQGACINQYLTTLLVVCVVSYLIGLIGIKIRYVRSLGR